MVLAGRCTCLQLIARAFDVVRLFCTRLSLESKTVLVSELWADRERAVMYVICVRVCRARDNVINWWTNASSVPRHHVYDLEFRSEL